MQPTTSSNKTMWTWIIVIVVLVIIGLLIFGGKKSDMDMGDMGSSTSMDNTTGSNTGSGAGAAMTGANTPAPAAIPSDATLMAMMNNGKIRVPQTGVDVALSGGQADYTSGSTKGHVALGSLLAKVTTDDGYDVFVTLVVTPTGPNSKTASENYVALFHVKGDVATFTSSVLVGTGLPITGVEAKRDPAVTTVNSTYPYMDSKTGYLLDISYMDRKNNEAMTVTPSVSKSFTVNVKNHVASK